MDLILQLLSKSLKKRDPQLDFWGSDERVLSIAYQDFMNYLKFHWGLSEQNAAELRVREKILSYSNEKPCELEEFVNIWTGIWIKKWGGRVKLIIGSQDLQRCKRADKLLINGAPLWRRLKDRHKIKDLIVEALIKHGEICGTSILAEDMIKIELGSCKEKQANINEQENLLGVVNKVLKKVRQISRSKGPLIFIRLNKRFKV